MSQKNLDPGCWWKVVHIAADRAQALAVERALIQEGLLVVLRPVPTVPGTGRQAVEVMVPRSEAVEAARILQALLGQL